MLRNSASIPALVLVALFALAGCKREAAPAPAPQAAPAAALPPAASDSMPVAAPAPAPAEAMPARADDGLDTGLDVRAFAGTFSGTLPCADCPGIDSSLRLDADSSFVMSETRRGRKAAPSRLEGTWSAEEGGRRIRLDPTSKSDQDRLYQVASRDTLTQLGSDGTPVANGMDYSLEREPTGP